MSDLRPLGNRLLVKPDVSESETSGGLLIPEVSRDQPEMSGTVIAKGRGSASANRIRQATIARCIEILHETARVVPATHLRVDLEDALARYASELVDLSEVVEGDRVCFPYTVGQKLAVDGQTFLILNEDDVIAVVQGEDVAA